MNRESFAGLLSSLRKSKKLSNSELAKLADVPRSFIAGLQSGKRRVGEYSARKIGLALGLCENELESFVLAAIDTCTEKLLVDSQNYPSQLVNHLPIQLTAFGISPQQLNGVAVNGTGIEIHLNDGRTAFLETTLAYA